MAYNRNTAWTDYWLRHLPWKKLRQMNRWASSIDVVADDRPESKYGWALQESRRRKIFREWARRKREGGGGMAAE